MSTPPGLRETTCARNRGSRALRGRAAQMSLPNGRARQALRRQKRLVWLVVCPTAGLMDIYILYRHNYILSQYYYNS